MAKLAPVDVGQARWAALPLLLTPILTGIAVAGPMPILSTMSRHFADTPGAEALVRMTMTSVGAAMIVGAPLAALLSERFGERRVFIAALALFGVAGAAGSLLNSLHVLVATRVVLGLALASSGVTTIALLTQVVPETERNRWLALLWQIDC